MLPDSGVNRDQTPKFAQASSSSSHLPHVRVKTSLSCIFPTSQVLQSTFAGTKVVTKPLTVSLTSPPGSDMLTISLCNCSYLLI